MFYLFRAMHRASAHCLLLSLQESWRCSYIKDETKKKFIPSLLTYAQGSQVGNRKRFACLIIGRKRRRDIRVRDSGAYYEAMPFNRIKAPMNTQIEATCACLHQNLPLLMYHDFNFSVSMGFLNL